MLVLSRKSGEKITVGEVTFTINRIKGNKVVVGIEAPERVKILRGELKVNEKQVAA